MTQDSQTETTTEDGNCSKDPAPQPHGKDPNKDCAKPAYDPKPPERTPKPDECKTCCTCPPGNQPPEDDCLEKLIRDQATTAAIGEEAKKSKAELEGFQAKLKTALGKYTPEAHADLVKRWQDNDKLLVDLIRSLTCKVTCWYCVIECEVCPLINAIAADERQLNGTNTLYTTTNSLYDQRYWWSRERDIRQAEFDRVSKVMKAWEDPFTTIDGIIKTLLTDIGAAGNNKLVGPEVNKLIFEVFYRFIPLHLAVAPPKEVAETAILRKYTALDCCDKPHDVDDCCGPNIGPLTVRERLYGPQPFLIPPDAYAALICCLATNAYQPAKAALAKSSAGWAVIDAQIEALKASIAARLKSLPADAKTRLGKTIDCNTDYKPKSDGDGTGDNKPCCGGDNTQPTTNTAS